MRALCDARGKNACQCVELSLQPHGIGEFQKAERIVGSGGKESACGWCKDRFGLSWQITPKRLTQLMAAGGENAHRAFMAMMDMRKIDIAALDRAVAGAEK